MYVTPTFQMSLLNINFMPHSCQYKRVQINSNRLGSCLCSSGSAFLIEVTKFSQTYGDSSSLHSQLRHFSRYILPSTAEIYEICSRNNTRFSSEKLFIVYLAFWLSLLDVSAGPQNIQDATFILCN